MSNLGMLTGNQEYPEGERVITNTLVRRIATADTWQDIYDASLALMRVQQMAMSMRQEMMDLARGRQQGPPRAPQGPAPRRTTPIPTPSQPYQYNVQQPANDEYSEVYPDDLPFNPNPGEEVEQW